MKRLKDIGAVVLAVILGLLGFFWWSNNNIKKVLADNDKAKEKLAGLDQQIQQNNTSLTQEEVKRNELNEDIKKVQDEKDTLDNVIDFFNKRS